MITIKEKIRTIIDYPKKGIVFRDITTLLKDPAGFKLVIDSFSEHYQTKLDQFDLIAGVEARGFMIAGALAYTLGKGLVPIRKPGKLPAKVLSEQYELEYGSNSLEVHEDAISKGNKVLLVDDLLATGGTALAAISLIERLGASIFECAVIINLPELGGSERLQSQDYSIYYLTEFSEQS